LEALKKRKKNWFYCIKPKEWMRSKHKNWQIKLLNPQTAIDAIITEELELTKKN
jgi:hypothetical protein